MAFGKTQRKEEADIGPEEEPVDHRRFVYIVLLIHGIGTLLPWNMFITAIDFFEYKLTGIDDNGQQLNYKQNFLSYLGIASKVPNVTVQLLNFLIGGK
jgi:equilibrative nucleoside transporter 1/2/3